MNFFPFDYCILNYHHLLLKINVCRSRSGSNQPEALSIEHPSHIEPSVKAKGNKKVKPTKKKQVLGSKNVTTTHVPLDSPSMGTRSKKYNHLVLQWAQEVKEGLVFDFRYACSHIWCHVSLNMFCMKAYLWTWTCICQLIIAYVCTWIIIVDFICILNSQCGSCANMYKKIVIPCFKKLL